MVDHKDNLTVEVSDNLEKTVLFLLSKVETTSQVSLKIFLQNLFILLGAKVID